VERDLGRAGVDVAGPALDDRELLPDLLPRLLELAVDLASGAHRRHLARTLVELAAPRPVQGQVLVAVELVDDRVGEDDAVARPVVSGEHLDLGVDVGPVADLAQAGQTLEQRLEARAAMDEASGLAEADLGLVTGRCSPRNHGVRTVLQEVERQAGDVRGLGVLLGHDQPQLADASEVVLEKGGEVVLDDPRLAVVEFEFSSPRSEVRDGEGLERLHGSPPK
jgi:hypothetical protein